MTTPALEPELFEGKRRSSKSTAIPGPWDRGLEAAESREHGEQGQTNAGTKAAEAQMVRGLQASDLPETWAWLNMSSTRDPEVLTGGTARLLDRPLHGGIWILPYLGAYAPGQSLVLSSSRLSQFSNASGVRSPAVTT
ncbi:hypothetical protein GX50_04326 [[Emmonsia] crescens]|uniref:Uncharacterized protein n=1 Tax=[Emmonsia] crescens TaxID=73230 RepID=A0A2B7ZI40_9EURO|nr:hypothetical protein GX50_04326 [Emmonsia crescens]